MDPLFTLYAKERLRLQELAKTDMPPGEYLRPVFGQGPPNPQFMFIGEAPGAEETRLGKPFVGKAGMQLDALLKSAGIERSCAYITNAVKYRPVLRKQKGCSNRTPTADEIAISMELLLAEICIVKPLVIATLGNVPLLSVLTLAGEKKRTVGETHGKLFSVSLGGRKRMLFPLYHPASVIYNRSLGRVMETDAHALKTAADGLISGRLKYE
ncbi:MAG: Uracil DNA glycosylase superfamily protein [Firmicutes bacterium ADurb.Bin182]|nr:MAG: Uracil DNA glycosylase superfamily protein [Firmicutes bacterium ADurb.Bin182]